MAKIESKCKLCRRAGEKLFLKGERCYSPKCAMVRHPNPPGIHGQRKGRRTVSEFASELREKQKVRFLYGLTERQFAAYIAEARSRRGVASDKIVELLERRLDNAVFRAGFAVSRSVARHMISYGHLMVNARPVSIPSYRVAPGDVMSIRPESISSPLFQGLEERWKQYTPPGWITLDQTAKTATIASLPNQENTPFDYDLQRVMQFYSR